MAKQKEIKTNAMRILDRMKIPYTHYTYECGEFIDGIQVADMLDLPHEKVYKTLVTQLSLIHISEPTRLGMISYAVFCLKKKKKYTNSNSCTNASK